MIDTSVFPGIVEGSFSAEGSDATSSPPKDPTNQVTAMVTSLLNEEKEKAKRPLNLIVHNVTESTSEVATIRKKHDINCVSDIFQQYLGTSATISKAFRLG